MKDDKLEKIKSLIKTKGITFATAAAIVIGGMSLTSCGIQDKIDDLIDKDHEINHTEIGALPSQDGHEDFEFDEIPGEDFPSAEENTPPQEDTAPNKDNVDSEKETESDLTDEIHNEDFPPLDENIFGN